MRWWTPPAGETGQRIVVCSRDEHIRAVSHDDAVESLSNASSLRLDLWVVRRMPALNQLQFR
jgi:hypothetical protein